MQLFSSSLVLSSLLLTIPLYPLLFHIHNKSPFDFTFDSPCRQQISVIKDTKAWQQPTTSTEWPILQEGDAVTIQINPLEERGQISCINPFSGAAKLGSLTIPLLPYRAATISWGHSSPYPIAIELFGIYLKPENLDDPHLRTFKVELPCTLDLEVWLIIDPLGNFICEHNLPLLQQEG